MNAYMKVTALDSRDDKEYIVYTTYDARTDKYSGRVVGHPGEQVAVSDRAAFWSAIRVLATNQLLKTGARQRVKDMDGELT